MRRLYLFLLVMAGLNVSCSEYTPKPWGYFRIELEQPEYRTYSNPEGHFSFHIQNSAEIEPVVDTAAGKWFNIVYPTLNATIYCSFFNILSQADLSERSEESRKFVYKHVIKADNIYEEALSDSSKKVYALIYNLDGEVASPLQFVITDSIRYFLRGSLYFYSRPNQDSIAPVKKYIRDDIEEMITSFRYGSDKQ
ncbi:MAG: gliding motility protein GldD [Dysgonamonadaceae bacterium]|nr:gliding motility protein GldD [Dysgonamonadaceae bacterium]